MKTIIISFLFACSLVYINNALSQDSSLTGLKFFKIYVTTSDDSMFETLQDEMGIDPKLTSYSIYVDIRSDSPKEQYLYLGDMNHPSAIKYNWGQFSDKMKAFLISWNRPNKMQVE